MQYSWDVKNYTQFLDLRTRPAKDLLNAISDSFQPGIVYDLGCGPGNSTILLKERWPNAMVYGLDSSDEMLAEARASYPDMNFVHGDISNFSPREKIDCLFANASLQWLPHHEILIPKLLNMLNPGGILAIQMPNNFHSPTHQVTINILQSHSSWESLIKNLSYGMLKKPLYELSWYYDLISQYPVESIQIWETTYFQEMSDHKEIFDWVRGTGLRPVLSEMNSQNQLQFEKEYINTISKEYLRQQNNKILLPFKRIFILVFTQS